MNKRIVILLLAIALLMTQFISCSKEGSVETVDTFTSETETDYLPVADFKGYEFTVLGREQDNTYILVPEYTGVALEEAIYQMNCSVSERYNIILNYAAGAMESMDEVRTANLAGDDIYDVVTTHAKHSFTLAQEDLMLDWKTDLPYINLDAEWWPKSASNEFEIGGHLYTMCGDLSYMSLARTKCLYFNKAIFDRYDVEYPYETVKNGEWTFEKMSQYALMMYDDIGNNGMNIEEDHFGYVTNWWGTPINIQFTAGIHSFAKDSDGMLTLDINSERTVNVFNTFFNFTKNEAVFVALADAGDLDIQQPFIDGRAAFIEFTMETAMFFGDMKDDFGILPSPKYDASISDYMTIVDGSVGLFMVPVLASDPERTSVILEAMAYYGNEYVIPEFYDNTLSYGASRDVESLEMLAIIRSSRAFDIAYHSGVSVFAYTGYYLCKNNNNFASLYENNELVAKTLIQQLNMAFSD